MRARTGRAVFLVGPSSAGKTSLGRALVDMLSEHHLLFETDLLGPRGSINRPELLTVELEEAVTRGSALAVRGYLDADVNLVVERNFWWPGVRQMAATVFQSYESFLVGLRWELAELERRERRRSDGILAGSARLQAQAAGDWDLDYDLVVDTMTKSPAEAAREVAEWLEASPEPRAIPEMARAGQ